MCSHRIWPSWNFLNHFRWDIWNGLDLIWWVSEPKHLNVSVRTSVFLSSDFEWQSVKWFHVSSMLWNWDVSPTACFCNLKLMGGGIQYTNRLVSQHYLSVLQVKAKGKKKKPYQVQGPKSAQQRLPLVKDNHRCWIRSQRKTKRLNLWLCLSVFFFFSSPPR